MKKYVISRENVCIGELFKIDWDPLRIRGSNRDKDEQEEIPFRIPCYSVHVCRAMLFNVNKDGLANDLIWTTPSHYLIEGINPKVDVITKFYISDYVKLEELLKFWKYDVALTQRDLNRIYKKLIANKDWLKNHRELFGFQKTSSGGYRYGGEEIISYDIYSKLAMITAPGEPDVLEPGYLIKRRK